MKEGGHEAKFVLHVEEHGGQTVKLYKKRGWPDRIVITPAGYLYWLEMKRPLGRVSKFQRYVHKILRGLKQDVRAAYDYQEAIEQYDEICS